MQKTLTVYGSDDITKIVPAELFLTPGKTGWLCLSVLFKTNWRISGRTGLWQKKNVPSFRSFICQRVRILFIETDTVFFVSTFCRVWLRRFFQFYNPNFRTIIESYRNYTVSESSAYDHSCLFTLFNFMYGHNISPFSNSEHKKSRKRENKYKRHLYVKVLRKFIPKLLYNRFL